MIKNKKAERVIKAAGSLSMAKHILANVPDKTAFFFSPNLDLYARTSMMAGGLLTSVYLGGRWVGWANPGGLIKLADLRAAVTLFEKSEMLSSASNDDPLILPAFKKEPSFGIGSHVVYLDFSAPDEVFLVGEIHINNKTGISYVLTALSGEKLKEKEAHIRKAMIQEIVIKKRINSIDEALTVTEVELLRGCGHA